MRNEEVVSLQRPSLFLDLSQREKLEIELLVTAIYRHYGFDFREYAEASLRRRILAHCQLEKLTTISSLQDKILHDKNSMEKLLLSLSINVTSMFRDPSFYIAFRKQVVPLLKTYPFVRIWHAGCSTGEEVYSMAILLSEENLIQQTRIYATDKNEVVLKKAKAGIFPMQMMKEYTTHYLQAGGKKDFSQYYVAKYDSAIFNADLRDSIVFSKHDLAIDQSFNEFNVILCRNVMIYFNQNLQNRVHKLFHESLCRFGVLVLGQRESLRFSSVDNRYEALSETEKIYKRLD